MNTQRYAMIKIACVIAWMTAIFFCALGRAPSAKTSQNGAQGSPVNLLEELLNYPIENSGDMGAVTELCGLFLVDMKERLGSETKDLDNFRAFASEVSAFTSSETVPGERLSIVNFADSNDKAIRRLRDQIKLPPPRGGAVVRIYHVKGEIPPPISRLFTENVEGITRWCRFIAIDADGMADDELKDTISHELTHAYICSTLGLHSDTLPVWFHEGVALYLSDAKDRYVSQTPFGEGRIASTPADYDEYHIVFNYLYHAFGEDGVSEFVRRALEDRSVSGALQSVAGEKTYDGLRMTAFTWRDDRKKKAAEVIYGLIALAALIVVFFAYRRRARAQATKARELHQAEKDEIIHINMAVHEIDLVMEATTTPEKTEHAQKAIAEIEKTALAMVHHALAVGKEDRPQAERLFKEAWEKAKWSPQVRGAIQKAQNEINGIRL